MEPEIEFLDRSSDCRERQNCRESGNEPESENSGSWMEMSRFSFSFQHETPTSLHKEVTESLVNDHVVSLPCVSVSEAFKPRRHRTSSSMAETPATMVVVMMMNTKTDWTFMMGVCARVSFEGWGGNGREAMGTAMDVMESCWDLGGDR